MRLSPLLILTTIAFHSLAMASPGFRLLQVPDPGQEDITVGLWYPTDTVAADLPNTKFGHALAVDAPLNDAQHRLIMLSHCLLYTSPSPRDRQKTRMPSSA